MTRSAVRICPAAPEKSLKSHDFEDFFFCIKKTAIGADENTALDVSPAERGFCLCRECSLRRPWPEHRAAPIVCSHLDDPCGIVIVPEICSLAGSRICRRRGYTLEFKGNACAFPCAIGACTACHQADSLRNYDMESSSAAYSRFHQPGWLTSPTNSGSPSMPVIAKTNGLSSVKSISSSGPIIAVASTPRMV